MRRTLAALLRLRLGGPPCPEDARAVRVNARVCLAKLDAAIGGEGE